MRTRNVSTRLMICCLSILLTVQSSWPLPPQIIIPSPVASRPESTIAGQTVTLLPDGNWLVVGGETKGGPVTKAVIVNPRTGARTLVKKGLSFARSWHTATLLPDATVLILGGQDKAGNVPQAELFDTASLSFQTIATGLTARTHHAATLLSDGRLLITGGIDTGGSPVLKSELWDPRTRATSPVDAQLPTDRRDDQTALLADGTAVFWGGADNQGELLGYSEVYDPDLQRFLPSTTAEASRPDMNIPLLEASLPEDGAVAVPVDSVISLRFSKLLRPETVTRSTVRFQGPTGSIPGLIVPAANGRLVFVSPKSQLAPGSKYTVTIDGPLDQQQLPVVEKAVSFTTVGPPSSKPAPQSNSDSNAGALAPLEAPPGVTAVSGRTLRLDTTVLRNVTLKIDNKAVRTDRTGRFLLANVSAGHHALVIDGRTASLPGRKYGVFETGIDLQEGKTLVLPYTIWMTELDMVHAVHIQFPTTQEVVVTTPTLPGLEFHIPPKTIVTDIDGKVADEISITPIPISQPPFPLPAVRVPIYFTIQPGGGYISVTTNTGPKGATLIYPNTFHQPTGTRMDFWNYAPDTTQGWFIYGQGTVSGNGQSVVPDPGVVLYELTGAMVAGGGGGPGTGPPAGGGGGNGGDPIDLSTGLFIYSKTDFYLPDVIPIVFTRTYRQNDLASRPFGIATTDSYDMFITGNLNDFSYVELVLPSGARVRFDRISGNFWNNSTLQCISVPGPFYGAIFSNQNGWTITMRDGTQLIFVQPGLQGPSNVLGVGLIKVIDRNGNTLTLTRDSNNNLTRITSPNGRWLQLTYDSSNRVTSAQDNIGRTVQYSYDTQGRLHQVIDANNGQWTYGWDPVSVDQMTSITDARGIQFLQNYYDGYGRVAQQLEGGSSIYTFSYVIDQSNNVLQTTVTNPNGDQHVVNYPSAATTILNGGGTGSSFVSPSGFRSGGYMSTETYAAGRPEQQTFSYVRTPLSNLLQSMTDALGRTTNYTYDVAGNMTSATALSGTPDAVAASFTYDPTFSRLTSTTDPLSRKTTYSYDSKGNLTGIVDPLGNSYTYSHNSAGQEVSAVDPLGNAVRLSYNGADLSSISDPMGNTLNFVSDGGGRIVAINDPAGGTTRFQYNALNLLLQKTDPLGGITQLQWDPDGRIQSVTDARNAPNSTVFTYDSLDREQMRTDPLGNADTFGYDANGNLTCTTDRRGKVSVIQYDGRNRPIFAGYGATNCAGAPYESTKTFSYDAGDRLTSVVDSASGSTTPVFDDFDRLVSLATPQGTVSYQYDGVGRRTAMAVQGQPLVNYTYDNLDRLTSVTEGSSSTTLQYDAGSRVQSLTLPNGVVSTYSHDADSHVTGISFQNGANSLGNLSYLYDSFGRVSQIGGSLARTGLPSAVASASYDAANRLTNWGGQQLSYDANGNLTGDGSNTYGWNGRNQLTSISGGVSASFQYDPFGRRITKTVASATVGFSYDGSNVIQELSGIAPTANIITGGIDQVFTRTGASSENFLTDILGSTVATTDTTGAMATQYTYEPFGNTTSTGTATTNSSQYTGRENDGTGLYYYRARYYNPRLQRFIGQDPLGFGGADLNLYAYAANDPVDFGDSSGMLTSNHHRDITTTAAANAGWGSPSDIAALAQDVVDVDSLPGTQGTSAAAANQHAMAGRKNGNGPYQNPCQAYTGAEKQLADDIAAGDTESIAKALHIIQDSRSPVHGPWAPWDGGSTIHIPTGDPFVPDETIDNVPSVSHMYGDLFPGDRALQDATVASQDFLRDLGSHDSALSYPENYLPPSPCH
jgi:RHS repeat-associated protein